MTPARGITTLHDGCNGHEASYSSYAKKVFTDEPTTQGFIPPRATRQLPVVKGREGQEITKILPETRLVRPTHISRIVDEFQPHPLAPYKGWLVPFIICMSVIVVA